jgi:hypothetical protein
MSQFNGVEKVRIFVFRGGDIGGIYFISKMASQSPASSKNSPQSSTEIPKFEK